MKQLYRAFSLGFACSLVVGVMAGQSAFGSVADIGSASGSSVSTSVSTSDSTVGSVNLTPGQVSSSAPWHWSPPPPPPTPSPVCAVPEANAGLILAALFPLMLLITPARVRKVMAAIRADGAVGAMA